MAQLRRRLNAACLAVWSNISGNGIFVKCQDARANMNNPSVARAEVQPYNIHRFIVYANTFSPHMRDESDAFRGHGELG